MLLFGEKEADTRSLYKIYISPDQLVSVAEKVFSYEIAFSISMLTERITSLVSNIISVCSTENGK
jgi:hypothetical protein